MMRGEGPLTSIGASMSEALAHPSALHPFHEPSRGKRLLKVGGWLVGIALVVVLLNVLGIDVVGWLSDLWEDIKDIPARYLVAALTLQTGQTVFAGLSYYGILRFAYPGQVEFWPIVTAYAVGVAMNNFLPANIGTFATLVMFVAIIPACTFPGRSPPTSSRRSSSRSPGRSSISTSSCPCPDRSRRASATSPKILCERSSSRQARSS